jgi:probable HAF family extracellular repeat protein
MTRLSIWVRVGVLAAAGLVDASAENAAVAAVAGPRYGVTDLGTLGGTQSWGYGINNSGQVTGFSYTSEEVPLGQPPLTHAFLWTPTTNNGTAGTLHDLGSPGVASAGYAINDRGQVTGIVHTGSGHNAFLWTPTSPNGVTGATQLIGTDDRFSEGRAINASGQIAGVAIREAGHANRALIWHSATPVGATGRLHFIQFQSGYSVAHTWGYGINDSGRVTGAAWFIPQSDNRNERAFVWTPSASGNAENGTLQDLGTLGGLRSTGFAINANGLVTGEAETTELRHAFLYDGAMHDLGTLGGVVSVGQAINFHGHVTGWSLTEDHRIHAFLYTSETGMVDLNSLIDPQSGWELQEARGINDMGQIVGAGLLNGEQRAFLLTPVPEPTAVLLVCAAAMTCRMIGRRHGSSLSLGAACLCIACCGRNSAAQPFFMGLGDVPGGVTGSHAHGVSADGLVVVGTAAGAAGDEAFRWTIDAGMVSLGANSRASDVSADGSVVVGQWGAEAFRWTQDTGVVGLGDLPGGAFRSFAKAVSGDGFVVAGIGWRTRCLRGGCTNIWPPVRWTGSAMQQVSMSVVPVFDRTLPLDISADGSVIVAGRFEAERWTLDGGVMPLGDLPGGAINSQAYGVSADGSVIVGQGESSSGREAFRWTEEGGMVGLGILPGFDSSLAQDLTADGSLVVGSLGMGSKAHAVAFIWDALHGMRELRAVLVNDHGLSASLAGWTLEYATAISADGRAVVGYGTNPAGNTEAWLAHFGDEPQIPGDFNGDGTVDDADLLEWQGDFGQNADSNADNDNDSDGADLLAWQRQLGFGASTQSSGSGPPIAAVPEPAPAALFFSGLLAAAMGPHRPKARQKNAKLLLGIGHRLG